MAVDRLVAVKSACVERTRPMYWRKFLDQTNKNSVQNGATIRVIPRLDVKGPNLISIGFDGWRVLGTPEYFAQVYNDENVDELIYQDVVASLFQREPCYEAIIVAKQTRSSHRGRRYKKY